MLKKKKKKKLVINLVSFSVLNNILIIFKTIINYSKSYSINMKTIACVVSLFVFLFVNSCANALHCRNGIRIYVGERDPAEDIDIHGILNCTNSSYTCNRFVASVTTNYGETGKKL